MANRYWVGGNSVWDATAGTKWALTNGGAGGQAVPTASDDVFFTTANTVTMSGACVCRSLNFTGFTGSFNHSATITIGTSTPGPSNIALKLVSGMTYTAGGTFSLNSTSNTQQTIDLAGKTVTAFTTISTSSTGNYILASNLTTTNNVNFKAGETSTGNYTVTCGGNMSFTGIGGKIINLGSSTVYVTGGNITGASLDTVTVNAGTSTIIFNGTGSASITQGGNVTYYNIQCNAGITGLTLGQAGASFTANDISITGTSQTSMNINGDVTANDLSYSGTAVNNRIRINGADWSYRPVVTLNSATIDYADIYNIEGAGSFGWNLSGQTVGDGGGNVGITFPSALTLYWIGGSGNFSDSAHWSLTSGGSAGGRVPYPHDTAIFDANSFTGVSKTITNDLPAVNRWPSMDWSNVTNSPIIAKGTSIAFQGQDITFHPTVTFTGAATQINFTNAGTINLNSNSVSYGTSTVASTSGADFYLQSDITVSSTLSIIGSLRTNDYTINCDRLLLANGTSTAINPKTMYFGNSTLNLGTSGNAVNLIQYGGVTADVIIDPGTSTIVVAGVGSGTRTLQGSSKNYYNLDYILSGSTGMLSITGSANFNRIRFSDASNARTLQLGPGSTYIINNMDGIRGTSGKKMTIQSSTTGNPLVTVHGGIVSTDYITLDDVTATGGAMFYAGANSNIVEDSPGWILANAPLVGSFLPFF